MGDRPCPSTPGPPPNAGEATDSPPTAHSSQSVAAPLLCPALESTSFLLLEARLVTERSGAYWHSWSPDGNTLFFTRPLQGSLNIYSIAVDGHGETPLTSGTGTNDDPDISHDGKYVYFNSGRSGSMEIWRMHPDGSFPEQITFDDLVNWTAHISPDGRWMVFLSYQKGTTGHPANQKISLRLMSLNDRKIRVLTTLIGGSGTINVPSWAPDSRHLAFVAYELTTPE
jgi:TolB protein